MKRVLALIICAFMACAGVCEAPERVAVLFSSYAGMWLEAGGSIYMTVGESVERGFAAEGTPLADSGAGKTINAELLIACMPDLVIASADIPAQASACSLMESAGIKTLCLKVESFEDYADAFRQMTDITGRSDLYEKYVTQQALEIESIYAENCSEGATYAFIRTGSTASSTKLKLSEEHFACGMLNRFGLSNIADGGLGVSGAVNIETLLARDPDYIFFSVMGNEEAGTAYIDSLISAPEWQLLSAVRNGRAIILPKELFHFKPCSRWAEACGYLAGLIAE